MMPLAELKGFKIFRIILWLFKPYKTQLFFLFLIMLASSSLEALNLAALYPVINYGLAQGSEGIILSFFNVLLNLVGSGDRFFSSCVLLMVITVLAVGARIVCYFISYRLMSRIVAYYQKEIVAKYIESDYGFFVSKQQGKLIYTGTISSKQAGSMVLYAITAANDLLTLVLIFSLLVLLTWQGTLAIAVLGAVYFFAVKRIMDKTIYKSGNLLLQAEREKNVILNELITGIKTIKVFLGFDAWRKKYYSSVDRSVFHQFKMLMGRVFPDSLMKLVFYVLIGAMGIVISRRTGGNIYPWLPLFGTFVLVSSRLFPAIQTFGNDCMVLVASLPNTGEVYDLLHENTRKIPEGTKNLARFSGEIVFEDVWFKFHKDGDFLFKGVNFRIEKDKVTAIVGPSGYGKTTLINLLLRLYAPDKGRITIDGVDIADYTVKSYLSKIGYVSQETFIYNDTILENIKFGIEECTEAMVIEAAQRAHAHDFIMRTRSGYGTIVGDAGMKLSGGQRQRLAIARALLRKPEIMVLDEATSSLDNISEKKVQEAINSISQFTTVVVIAHRLSTIRNADTILVLNDGRIVEQGSHDALLGKNGAYHNLYNMQLTHSKGTT
jgi:ATP-binding cassette, subfamily B, bacterial